MSVVEYEWRQRLYISGLQRIHEDGRVTYTHAATDAAASSSYLRGQGWEVRKHPSPWPSDAIRLKACRPIDSFTTPRKTGVISLTPQSG